MSGKASRDKGARIERMIVSLFTSWGLRAERVPLSGAMAYQSNSDDVDVYKPGRDAPFICQVKGGKLPIKTITKALDDADILVLRPDRSPAYFLLPERTMKELLS